MHQKNVFYLLVYSFGGHFVPFLFTIFLTRSTGTVHTSAKTRLTSVTIQIRIHRHQNVSLITCSLAHCQPSLKISCKSVQKFSAKLLTDKQTERQTNNDYYISFLAKVTIKLGLLFMKLLFSSASKAYSGIRRSCLNPKMDNTMKRADFAPST